MKGDIREFTKRGRAVNGEIERQLDLVCEQILKDIPDARSIILTGGFARGEGSVKVVGKRVFPFNDYDITVVAERSISKEEVDRIAVNAARKLGMRGIVYFYSFKKLEQRLKENFYIDLKVVTKKELVKMFPRIRNYELRNHGLVLYGDDLRSLVPPFSLRDVPLAEGAKLLLDRMSQMIEYFSVRGEYNDDVLTYFIQQAYTACCTSLLLLSGNYDIGYKKSMTLLAKTYKSDFPELHAKVPDLHKQIKKYVEWRLKPDKLPDNDVEGAWFRAREDLYEVAKYYFSKFLGKKVTDMSGAILNMGWEFHKYYLECKFGPLARLLHPFAVFYLKYKYFNRVRRQAGRFYRVFLSTKSPDAQIFSVVPLIMMSLDKRGDKFIMDKAMYAKAVKSLKRVYPVTRKLEDWDDLSLYYADAYIAFFLQKLG